MQISKWNTIKLEYFVKLKKKKRKRKPSAVTTGRLCLKPTQGPTGSVWGQHTPPLLALVKCSPGTNVSSLLCSLILCHCLHSEFPTRSAWLTMWILLPWLQIQVLSVRHLPWALWLLVLSVLATPGAPSDALSWSTRHPYVFLSAFFEDGHTMYLGVPRASHRAWPMAELAGG